MDARDAVQHMMLFRGVEAADVDAVAAIAEPSAYAAGERVFDEFHAPDALYVILMGMVEITGKGKDIPVVTLGSGQSLGDVAFFERDHHGRAAHTREATRVLRIPYAALDHLLAERPGLALIFYRNAATYFAHHLAQMAGERDRPYF